MRGRLTLRSLGQKRLFRCRCVLRRARWNWWTPLDEKRVGFAPVWVRIRCSPYTSFIILPPLCRGRGIPIHLITLHDLQPHPDRMLQVQRVFFVVGRERNCVQLFQFTLSDTPPDRSTKARGRRVLPKYFGRCLVCLAKGRSFCLVSLTHR